MQAYHNHKSVVALLNRANIDTDQIIAKQFLKRVERTGFGQFLFYDWRYHADGSENLTFELNNPAFNHAKILLTGNNFGCGSSREHAPWAIMDYGFNTVIACSFADIFYNNCYKNGILPIALPEEQINELMKEIALQPGAQFEIDLPAQKIISATNKEYVFEIDNFRKNNLLKGLDDISQSLNHVDKITEFEKRQKLQFPWLWKTQNQ